MHSLPATGCSVPECQTMTLSKRMYFNLSGHSTVSAIAARMPINTFFKCVSHQREGQGGGKYSRLMNGNVSTNEGEDKAEQINKKQKTGTKPLKSHQLIFFVLWQKLGDRTQY